MRLIGFAFLAIACGPAAVPDTEVGGPDDEAVHTGGDAVANDPLEGPRTLFAAQIAALESQDAVTFLDTYAEENVFLVGPIASAVHEGASAIDAQIRQVVDSSGEVSVQATERRFELTGEAAWSLHEVRITPADVRPTYFREGAIAELVYETSSVYRQTGDAWHVMGQSWAVVVPAGDYPAMAARLPPLAPVAARNDESCAAPTAALQAWLAEGEPAVFGDDPPAALSALATAVARRELGVEAGPGGIRAQSIGELCVLLANQLVVDRSESPARVLPHRVLVVFRSDVAAHTQMMSVVPDAPLLEEGEDPAGEEDEDAEDEDAEDEGAEDGDAAPDASQSR